MRTSSLAMVFLLACGGSSPEPPSAAEPLDAPVLPGLVEIPVADVAVVTAESPDCSALPACEAACAEGDALACNLVGLTLHDGRSGASPDRSGAARSYRQACNLGAGIGCYNLSHMVRSGDGVPADEAEADRLLERTHRLYEAACTAGGLTWCTNLAGLVQRGEGREPDQTHARNLYTDTCERGDPMACLELAHMMAEGLGGGESREGAMELLSGTCEAGSGPACNNLGLMVRDGGGDPTPRFRQACELGVPMGCRNLALQLPEDERLPLLSTACDAVRDLDPLACAMAAQMLLATASDGPTVQRAGSYLVRACSVGLAEACVPAVQLVAEQRGFTLPPREARALVQRGCALGDATACAILEAPPAP
jgi:TPR repeat protein